MPLPSRSAPPPSASPSAHWVDRRGALRLCGSAWVLAGMATGGAAILGDAAWANPRGAPRADSPEVGVDPALVASGLTTRWGQAMRRDLGWAARWTPLPSGALLRALAQGDIDMGLFLSHPQADRLAQEGLIHDRHVLARTDVLRIHVNVPQSSVLAVRPGQPAKVLVQEYPGKEFVGTVSRIAGAMDPASRTLVTEVMLPNKDGKLIPGMYAQVKFDLPRVVSQRLPSSVLVTGSEGTRVALVSAGNKVHYVPVKVGRDFGSEVEILTGITPEDHVIVGPSAALKEGTTVRPVALPAPDHK